MLSPAGEGQGRRNSPGDEVLVCPVCSFPGTGGLPPWRPSAPGCNCSASLLSSLAPFSYCTCQRISLAACSPVSPSCGWFPGHFTTQDISQRQPSLTPPPWLGTRTPRSSPCFTKQTFSSPASMQGHTDENGLR